jgi:hypothetical protein
LAKIGRPEPFAGTAAVVTAFRHDAVINYPVIERSEEFAMRSRGSLFKPQSFFNCRRLRPAFLISPNIFAKISSAEYRVFGGKIMAPIPVRSGFVEASLTVRSRFVWLFRKLRFVCFQALNGFVCAFPLFRVVYCDEQVYLQVAIRFVTLSIPGLLCQTRLEQNTYVIDFIELKTCD